MKFATGSSVVGLMLAWVGCSQAFVAPAGTGESLSFMKTQSTVVVLPVMKQQTGGGCRVVASLVCSWFGGMNSWRRPGWPS